MIIGVCDNQRRQEKTKRVKTMILPLHGYLSIVLLGICLSLCGAPTLAVFVEPDDDDNDNDKNNKDNEVSSNAEDDMVEEDAIERTNHILDWIRDQQQQGEQHEQPQDIDHTPFVHAHLQVNNGPFLVTTHDIAADKVLLSIPSDWILFWGSSGGGEGEEEERISWDACETAWTLLQVASVVDDDDDDNNNDNNDEGLYFMRKFVLSFLEDTFPLTLKEEETVHTKGDTDHSQQQLRLPMHWSKAAKSWIQQVVGTELEPKRFGSPHHSYVDECQDGILMMENEVYKQFDPSLKDWLQHAYEIVHDRGWNQFVVPVYHWIQRQRHMESSSSSSSLMPNVKLLLNQSNDNDNINNNVNNLFRLDRFHLRHGGNVLQFVAARDIAQGEVLFIDDDTADWHGTFITTSDHFARTGQVGPYPQLWSFSTGYDNVNPWSRLVFVLDQLAEPAKDHDDGGPTPSSSSCSLQVTWYLGDTNDNLPTFEQRNWLQAHRKRLLDMHNTTLDAAASTIPNQREREWAVEYYTALVTALDQAVIWSLGNPNVDDDELTACVVAATAAEKDSTTQVSSSRRRDVKSSSSSTNPTKRPPTRQRHYETLHNFPDLCDYSLGRISARCSNPVGESDVYEIQNSPYQQLEWAQFLNPQSQKPDTCLMLEGVIHSCLSYRSQVHEFIVQYPASFLHSPLRRVLFVGGGDLVILHEILKYPSLELVVGMELDQTVVRSAFRHYGVQPHFDDERVQWWFGDASKSLAALPPQEYFASFDLVLVDLLTYTFSSLQVEGETLLVDYLMKLVKPEGILVRQEDYMLRHHVDFAQYTVDYNLFDIPYICIQPYTMGSQTIDFLSTPVQDADIETIYYNPSKNSTHNHTALWAGYRTTRRTPQPTVAPIRNWTNPHLRTLVILEVEEITLSSLNDPSTVSWTLSQALTKAGLMDISVIECTVESNWFTHILSFHKGYLVARTWPGYKYMALDILLWNQILDARQQLWTELRLALMGGGGHHHHHPPSTLLSSFRIVTGGMFGLNEPNLDNNKNDATPDECVVEEMEKGEKTKIVSSTMVAPLPSHDYDTILQQFISFLGKKSENATISQQRPVWVVICSDRSSSCVSLATLSKQCDIISLWSCTNRSSKDGIDDSQQERSQQQNQTTWNLVDCERRARRSLYEVHPGKIQGIVVDPDAPIAMGKIIHKILNHTRLRYELLVDDFVILAPTLEQTISTTITSSSLGWRHALLERFRMEIVQVNPVFHTNVMFHRDNNNDENKSRSLFLNMGVLSANDQDFYTHLLGALRRIQQVTALDFEILDSKVGFVKHIPDFQPTAVFSSDDFDMEPSRQQYLGQHPVGYQAILQFEVHPKVPISEGAIVLVNDIVAAWLGTWSQGRVVEANNESGGEFVVETMVSGEQIIVERQYIREVNHYSAVSPLQLGELVLIQFNDVWHQGAVTQVNEDGTYELQAFDGDVLVLERSHLIRQTEKPVSYEEFPDALSMNVLKDVLEDVLRRLDSLANKGNPEDRKNPPSPRWRNVGDGCLFTGFFSGGGIVAAWDGRRHMDVNLFFEGEVIIPQSELLNEVEQFIVDSIPDISRVQYDVQPRGFGRVVNTQEDLNKLHWFGSGNKGSVG